MSNEPMKIGFTYCFLQNMMFCQKKYRFHIEGNLREMTFAGFLFNPFRIYPMVMWRPATPMKDEAYWHCVTELNDAVINSKDPYINGKRIIVTVMDGYLSQEEEIAKLKTELEVCNRTIESLHNKLHNKKHIKLGGGRPQNNETP